MGCGASSGSQHENLIQGKVDMKTKPKNKYDRILRNRAKLNEVCERIFEKVDKKKRLFVPGKKIYKMVKTVCKDPEIGLPPPDKSETDNLLDKYDENGDGQISFDEFQNIVVDMLVEKRDTSPEDDDEKDLEKGKAWEDSKDEKGVFA
uniref:EF-hand domain-containing protein n=1 Tax=Chromera velia CCMP2878 TaxID=1169474 RepID=A0A0G4GLP1_9ALVE|mmetsp:Transcript_24592/g.48269  ORF Transcript_24592/g.48269 Transcript_24592/m.48269 type:complete len:148 (-) Transcript_24592:1757-2200(-)|eukprot:Cvel_22448.t1-p1 / transcript=Cvel_22448.t1 / gene=Cvel_22448 / organism=Chromera_velia_CCMP2878 / gene_product=hypothetical protein / transcript_product=hypothetical protein / location=Cvel_scaffold2206:27410-28470(-) / protein_length=147 / sequence_SO=supercontig / SO=protein_coding / is_pseudo=false